MNGKQNLPASTLYPTVLGLALVLSLCHYLGLQIRPWPIEILWYTGAQPGALVMGLGGLILLSLLMRQLSEQYMLQQERQPGLGLMLLGCTALSLGWYHLSSLVPLLTLGLMLYLLFGAYQIQSASRYTFPTGLLLGVLATYQLHYLMLLPILLYLLYPLRALSLRNALGMLIGFFVVAWIVIPASWIFPQLGMQEYLRELWIDVRSSIWDFPLRDGGEWMSYLPFYLIILLWVLSVIGLSGLHARDNVRRRDYGTALNRLSLLLILSSLVWQSEQAVLLLQLALLPLSIRHMSLLSFYTRRTKLIILGIYSLVLLCLVLLY